MRIIPAIVGARRHRQGRHRHGMDYVDPGASYYETRYRERVIENLQRRAKAFGFVLQAAVAPVAELAVS